MDRNRGPAWAGIRNIACALQLAGHFEAARLIGDDAYLVVVAGVRDCADLARQTATVLHSRVTDLAAKLGIADFKLDPEVTKRWVAAASDSLRSGRGN
jgi:hypothetical protein